MSAHRESRRRRTCLVSLLLIGGAGGCRGDSHERWATPPAPAESIAHSLPVPELPVRMRAIQPSQLCISLGFSEAVLQKSWVNLQPKVRATVADSQGQQAALSFRYLGPTPGEQPLRSGLFRRQLGLKLLAEDTCNLLYVMWRFDDPSQIAVSIKRNPDQHLHVECTNHGYHSVRPSWSVPVAAPAPQSVHELAAHVQESRLEVSVDGKPVLRADLSAARLPKRGVAGLRSDNVAFELVRFAADLQEVAPPESPAPCRPKASGSEESD